MLVAREMIVIEPIVQYTTAMEKDLHPQLVEQILECLDRADSEFTGTIVEEGDLTEPIMKEEVERSNFVNMALARLFVAISAALARRNGQTSESFENSTRNFFLP